MDWARDYLGNDVPAWQGGISGFGLTCPCCGERVLRRAGGERRPHFAHYSHRAKPDCENYFPSQDNAAMSALGTGARGVPGGRQRESLSCGLFLAAAAGQSSLTLWLRIPPCNLEAPNTGRLEIQTGFGLRTYQLAELSATRLVSMAPQFPLATIAGFGGLLPLAAELAGQVSAFSADRNLFYVDEKGGRFIFSDEPLEWGTRYRLLSAQEIAPPQDFGSVLRWKPEGRFGGWYSYELELPTAFAGSKPNLPQKISDFLEHRIRSPRPRLYVVDPLPHHIDSDGTYVYPEPPESLLLRRSGSGEISVTTSVDTIGSDIYVYDDEWVRVSGPWASGCEYVLAIASNEQVIFRIQTCELFSPDGVTVNSTDLSWDLCTDAPLDAQALVATTIDIDCRSVRIAAHLARRNNGWFLKETRLSLPSGLAKELRASSFGELRSDTPTSLHSSENNCDTKPGAQQSQAIGVNRWIDWLVIRDYGVEGASNVKRYLSNPNTENLYRLGPIMTSHLMPYIQAMQHQQRNRTEGGKDL